MAFYALMFGASDQRAYLRGPHSTADSAALLRLSYKTQAMKLINELINKRLHKCGRDSIDALLISVSALAVHGSERDTGMEQAHPQSPLAKVQFDRREGWNLLRCMDWPTHSPCEYRSLLERPLSEKPRIAV
jgi:hypothetical protein